jgi:hypothetical protein
MLDISPALSEEDADTYPFVANGVSPLAAVVSISV